MEYWDSYFYLYGVGGLLFFLALFLGLKKGVLNLKRKEDQKLMIAFIFAYVAYASFHAFWNFQAIGAMK